MVNLKIYTLPPKHTELMPAAKPGKENRMTDVRLARARRAKASLRALAREATSAERRVLLDIASDFGNRITLRTNPWADARAARSAWRLR